ncbi:MAG: hypothetical protein K8S62_03010 [Candidatus Sabulitectum sp.]|nr:hypothetical protein [Candidatus Sabulitectum sp.]
MRITVVLMVLLSAVMIADTDQQYGIEGEAFVNGQDDWEGYFIIIFTEPGTLNVVHKDKCYNDVMPADYYYCTWETLDIHCIYYHPDSVAPQASCHYYNITGDWPITVQDIYFVTSWDDGGASTETPVFGPEPLSLSGATWAEIKALSF